MPNLLRKQRFRATDIALPEIQNFHCGTQPWELEVSNWIKGLPGGVLDDMARPGGCDVWLYRTQSGILVGFGSLSEPQWGHPNRTDPRPSLIPMLGLRSEFRGHPLDVPREDRYAWQIMDDLAIEAAKHDERAPVLVLYVHPENERAIKFYESYGFLKYHRTYKDDSGTIYRTMRYHLDSWKENPGMTSAEKTDDNSRLAQRSLTFEQAVTHVLNSPPTPEQQAKKATAKSRRAERKKQAKTNDAAKEGNNGKR